MAVESLECCLSRAIGSSCTGETQTYSERSLAVLCGQQGRQCRDAWCRAAAVWPIQTSIPIPIGLTLRIHHRVLFCSPSEFQKAFDPTIGHCQFCSSPISNCQHCTWEVW